MRCSPLTAQQLGRKWLSETARNERSSELMGRYKKKKRGGRAKLLEDITSQLRVGFRHDISVYK